MWPEWVYHVTGQPWLHRRRPHNPGAQQSLCRFLAKRSWLNNAPRGGGRACRRLDNYAYLVKKYCGDVERNTCGPDADLDTIRQQMPLTVG